MKIKIRYGLGIVILGLLNSSIVQASANLKRTTSCRDLKDFFKEPMELQEPTRNPEKPPRKRKYIEISSEENLKETKSCVTYFKKSFPKKRKIDFIDFESSKEQNLIDQQLSPLKKRKGDPLNTINPEPSGDFTDEDFVLLLKKYGFYSANTGLKSEEFPENDKEILVEIIGPIETKIIVPFK